MTIKINIKEEELKSIAAKCEDSQEFAKHICNLIGLHKTDEVLAELREVYRNLSVEVEKEKAWKKFDTIDALLRAKGLNRVIYYECWIDLEESWLDKWFSVFRLLDDKQILEVCEKYLFERERFYGSKDYIDRLNNLVAVK